MHHVLLGDLANVEARKVRLLRSVTAGWDAIAAASLEPVHVHVADQRNAAGARAVGEVERDGLRGSARMHARARIHQRGLVGAPCNAIEPEHMNAAG